MQMTSDLGNGFQEHPWFTVCHRRYLRRWCWGSARQARSSRVYPASEQDASWVPVEDHGHALLDSLRIVPDAADGHQKPEGLAHRCSPPLSAVRESEIGPAQTPPLNPTAAGSCGRRVLSRGGVADHEVTPKAPLTGSGCREYSYGGFGGGHSHFQFSTPWRAQLVLQRLGQPSRMRPLCVGNPISPTRPTRYSGAAARGCMRVRSDAGCTSLPSFLRLSAGHGTLTAIRSPDYMLTER
jgi:hypothetical protein